MEIKNISTYRIDNDNKNYVRNGFKMGEQKNNIKLAFCFDNNLVKQICVTVASLLDASKNSNCHYDIYCVCANGAEKVENKLKKIVKKRDKFSNVFISPVENKYKNGYEIRKITSGAYLRLQLHNILSNLDKIIYCDVDILFKNNLQEIWDISIDDNYFMGVKGANNLSQTWNINLEKFDYWKNFEKNTYINSGVVVMNLKKIREDNLEIQWEKMVNNSYFYVDQDIINIVCKNKIGFLPLKYNLPAYLDNNAILNYEKENIYNKNEVYEAINNPSIIHYAGEKPWDNPNILNSDYWFNYVKSQNDLKKIFKIKRKLFDIKNEYSNNKKYKVITLFGIKFKFKIKKQNKTNDRNILPILPRLEIHVCDQCNLNCRGCSHYCNLVQEDRFVDINNFEKDIKEVAKKLNFSEIKLLGGEPLLHPNLIEFFRLTREAFPKIKIILTTNLILLDTMKEDFWEAMKKYNIVFQLTKYPPMNKKFVHYLDLIASYNIPIDNIHVANEFWLFKNPNGNSKPQEVYKQCCEAYCRQLRDGRLYICPDACYMDYYNKYFDKNIPVDKGIDIYKHTSSEIYNYLTTYKETCRYCFGKDKFKYVRWEKSQKQSDEWDGEVANEVIVEV